MKNLRFVFWNFWMHFFFQFEMYISANPNWIKTEKESTRKQIALFESRAKSKKIKLNMNSIEFYFFSLNTNKKWLHSFPHEHRIRLKERKTHKCGCVCVILATNFCICFYSISTRFDFSSYVAFHFSSWSYYYLFNIFLHYSPISIVQIYMKKKKINYFGAVCKESKCAFRNVFNYTLTWDV